jgi:hypothetical protein
LDDVTRTLDSVFNDARCPGEVSVLRGIGIKHHLMVLVSLAFIQEETQLGQDFLKKLIRLDPSILEGFPCELVEFLLQESVADHGLDHEELLEQIFAQLPPETSSITQQYDWAVARGHLVKGTREMIWDLPGSGNIHFSRAAELRAHIDQIFLQSLSHQLLAYENEFGDAATVAVIRRVSPCLKQVGGWLNARRLMGFYAVEQAFHYFRTGNYQCVPTYVYRAVRCIPKYLLNRGVVSVLVRSTVARSFQRDVREAATKQ